MARKRQGFALTTRGPEVERIVDKHRLDLKADRLQTRNQQRLTARVIRAERRAADKLLRQFDDRTEHIMISPG